MYTQPQFALIVQKDSSSMNNQIPHVQYVSRKTKTTFQQQNDVDGKVATAKHRFETSTCTCNMS